MSRKPLVPLLLLLFLVLSCDNQTLGTMKKPESLTGEPLAGSQTLVLTGSSYLAKTVTINGRSLDTSSVQTIADSVGAIFASQYSDGTLISAAGASEIPDYTIDFTAGTPVSDIFYGVNIQIASKAYLTNPVYRELAKNLKLDLIRFPGGQERVKYDRNAAADAKWEFGSSAEYQYLLTGADVANYIALCRLVGAKADLEFNVFTNDPAMWRSAADHIVNGLNYNLEYMSVGNEPDINNNSNWSLFGASNVTEAMNAYTNRYVAYAQQIRQVKPGITFVFGELANNADPILGQFLNNLPALNDTPPGAFSAHWYLLGDYGQGAASPDFPSVNHLVISGNSGRNIRNLAAIHDTIRAKLDDTQPGSKVIIGEMASSWSATAAGADVEDSLATAIYTAEVMEYGRVLGIDSIQYFGLSDPSSFAPWNSAMIVENGGAFFVRPQYYSRMLIKHAWGNLTVPVTSGQTDNYSIYASSGTADYLMLINRTVNVSYKKVLRLVTSANPDGASVEVLILPQSVTVIKLSH